MRKLLILISFLLISVCTYAQRVSVESFSVNTEDFEAKLNPIYDIKAVPGALIRIKGRIEGLRFEGNIILGPVMEDDEYRIYMRAESTELTIRWGHNKHITYTFPTALKSALSYDMTIQNTLPKEEERKYLLMADLGYNAGKYSYGMMAATMKRIGGYVKVMSNFNTLPQTDYVCNEYGGIGSGLTAWYTGKDICERISLTAGGISKLAKNLYGFGGIGYGKRNLAWEMYGDKYALVDGYSFSGPEVEIGGIYNIGPIAVSAGFTMLNAKWFDAMIGIGFLF